MISWDMKWLYLAKICDWAQTFAIFFNLITSAIRGAQRDFFLKMTCRECPLLAFFNSIEANNLERIEIREKGDSPALLFVIFRVLFALTQGN